MKRKEYRERALNDFYNLNFGFAFTPELIAFLFSISNKRKIKSETRQGPKERQGRFKGIILRKEGEKGN
jgi:hypothetical protein